MPRLIYADALMTELSTMYKEPTSTEDFMAIGYDKAIADVVVTAHRQPTADAVEVVRCRDCKHFVLNWWEKVGGISLIVGHEICQKWGKGCKTSLDGFCFFGERRDNDETD